MSVVIAILRAAAPDRELQVYRPPAYLGRVAGRVKEEVAMALWDWVLASIGRRGASKKRKDVHMIKLVTGLHHSGCMLRWDEFVRREAHSRYGL